MKQVITLEELRQARAGLRGSLGFVPTMGFLHAGHLSLVDLAKRDCDSVAVSIFVNPTQFGPQEDLAAYPRDLPADLQKLEAAGVDLVWLPTPEIIYPQGFNTWVSVEGVSQPLEGAARPGHFRGVATVVLKLFNIVQPHRAYFGQKDAQQCAVVRQLVRDLNLGVEIVVCPIVREPDGLAMSSRNAYLDPDERQAARVLYESLCRARELMQGGERRAQVIAGEMRRLIAQEPRARLDYVAVVDAETLQPVDQVRGRVLVPLAVWIGRARLLDNLLVEEKDGRFSFQF